MRIFMTLLVDSLRLLRARMLFWVTLGISTFVALIYLSIGFTGNGVSVLFGFWKFESDLLKDGSEMADLLYLGIFSNFLIGFWLTFFASILALIACSSIFPDFLKEGSIGIALSKPASRLGLFLSKYVGSLLFVVLQVSIFSVIIFVAVRWRLGAWNLSVFWAVPIVTLMFSYIYSVVVLVGVKTGSTLAALLAGIGVWLGSFTIQLGEDYFYTRSRVELGSTVPSLFGGTPEEMKKWYDLCRLALAPLPKTGGTTRLLDRLIVVKGRGTSSGNLVTTATRDDDPESSALREAATRHSVFYIIGTSLAFEAVMLGWAAWIFCRRDY